MSDHDKIPVDVPLVQQLIAEQFPEWADFEIRPVEFINIGRMGMLFLQKRALLTV